MVLRPTAWDLEATITPKGTQLPNQSAKKGASKPPGVLRSLRIEAATQGAWPQAVPQLCSEALVPPHSSGGHLLMPEGIQTPIPCPINLVS